MSRDFMRCLSVQQPWAWLLAHGHKDIENRTRQTNLRGWVLLHAGLTMQFDVWPVLAEQMPHIAVPPAFDMTRGAIIGAIRIDDCVTASASPWFSGPNGYVIGKAMAFEPEPRRGMLGFFQVELDPFTLTAQLTPEILEGAA